LHYPVHTSTMICMNDEKLNFLVDALLRVKTRKEMESMLRGLLTQKELEELPKRLEIFKQLKKGVPQHEIADKVGVGVATVTRGSQEIQRGQIQQTIWWQSLSPLRG
jgi:TrpR family transcriptional regulator, trp operon repressor